MTSPVANYKIIGYMTLPDGTQGNVSVAIAYTPDPFTSGRPMLGLNHSSAYQAISGAVGGLPGVRTYGTPGKGIPAAYPGTSDGALPAGAHPVVVSLKPDIPSFIQGAQDAAFSQYVRSCPDGTMLTLWHEGERANEGHAGQQIRNLHERAYGLVKAARPGVKYGQTVTCYSAVTGHISGYMANGMDFYGLDGYASASGDTAASIFGTALSQIRADLPKGATVAPAILEVNSFKAGLRPAFFRDTWAWAKANNCITYFVYADAPGDNSNGVPWDTSDSMTVATLATIVSAG